MPSERSTVLMEEPGFNKAVSVFINNKMEVQTVPVDENGLMVSGLPIVQNTCAVYSTPSHQFPTGATLPIDRRYELLEWVTQNDVYIIEDDFDSELRYYTKPIPSLQSIDLNDRVIYLGTFSKALSPSIRMGYMVLPPKILQRFLEKFETYNSTVPLLNQLLEFSEEANQDELIDKALEQGVKVYSTMQFWQEKAACPPNTLFLGFSKIKFEDIPDCVARLKAAWAEWL